MNLDMVSNQIYIVAVNEAKLQKHEYVTPEHFLYAALMFDLGKEIIEKSGGNVDEIILELQMYFKNLIMTSEKEKPIESFSLIQMFEFAARQVLNSQKEMITLGNLLVSLFLLKDSYAVYILEKNEVSKFEMTKVISHEIKEDSMEKFQTSKKSTEEKEIEFLNKFTQNFTQKARLNEFDKLIGREEALNHTIQILSRRLKNNPIHVGNPGVGKTSLVEGLAQKIVLEEVPSNLKNAEIFYIDMGTIIAGTKFRGDFEERLIKIFEIIKKYENPIIYFDEIHTVVGAGNIGNGGMDATSIIKPLLSKGDIRFIGSTTFEEYKKFIEKDKALSRRFQQIEIEEPSVSECIEILCGIKQKYEDFHNVIFTDEIIKYICELSSKYMNDRFLPDKAIDALDETGAFVNLNNKKSSSVIITKKDVERTISQITKTPTKTISSDDLTSLQHLENNLKTVVFGQEKAIKDVVNAIKLSRSGLKDEFKPISNLLFVGPTGVGKTEIAKQVSNQLGIKLIRYDMSEYQEKHSVSRLIGSPPGYVGFEGGGLLTEEIRRTPHCVLLLDEIEKAHNDILNVLLQVMDYGTLTDNIGNKADFKNVILIMTSNAGASLLGKKIIGFEDKKLNIVEIDNAVEKSFSPEFRNRLDAIVVFNHITKEMASDITNKELKKLSEKLLNKSIKLKVSKNLLDYISNKGLSEKYGAREILRVINDEIKKLLVEEVLFGQLSNGGIASLDYKKDEILLKIKSS